jgi:hypothetical protein
MPDGTKEGINGGVVRVGGHINAKPVVASNSSRFADSPQQMPDCNAALVYSKWRIFLRGVIICPVDPSGMSDALIISHL